MLLIEISQQRITDFFLNDPKLALSGLSDEELNYMRQHECYPMAADSTYLGIFLEDQLVAIVKYEMFTTHSINFHMYIKTELQKTNQVEKIVKKVKEHFEALPNILKALIMVPRSCLHVIEFAKKWGWILEGTLSNCCLWRQKIDDIIIYGLMLKEIN